ncbi:MAG: hypothetical protein COT39_04175 [Parcubacteria group bacterium CG08_land_8_20_14_0_20_48_21]|nr:MAG: hypothetical protein AUK21_00800 [Parcubacteria group bacterium CG2_30_48_51]PIS32511.1 MAG: hypothetical protein COT39_04175 [Parcubacteria group bacterium CG08_land_8_20_14_0_20_48_21]PIW79530.1 MAG: hypothetical protein COZ99_00565 [Parcubacteria group bacterium CG_4_8_14_3_um_filter_48_16]PIY78096.1 MAG: hypothetical protein COY83_01695 [Parcubacteria group bacterium CG_4_10_14_0_8_um_filter_48_154]PIZ77663.1 MAG: hypothetical protein COY03_02075 [bacterium CG_4_10_14_0_2_um_filter_
MEKIREVLPAILTSSARVFRLTLEKLAPFAPFVQIDILDNTLAEGRTLLPLALKRELISLPWEAHLMVARPQKYMKDLAAMGCKRIIFHVQAVADGFEFIQDIRRRNIEAGIAMNPEDPIVELAGYSQIANTFMVMGVVPGKQGQRFNPKALATVAALKKRYPGIVVSVDGGVRKTNIQAIARAGADRFAVGSAITGSPNAQSAYEKLYTLANSV